MTLDGKVATRDRRLEVDLRRGSRASAPTAGAPQHGRRRRRHRHRARRRPAADGARRRRRAPAAPRRVRLDRAPAAGLPARRRSAGRGPAHGRRVRAPRRARDRRAAQRRRRRRRSRPASTSRRASSPRSTGSAQRGVTSILLEGGPHLAGAFLDAGEIDELRLFLAPARARRLAQRARPAGGRRASSASARRCGATELDCERIGEDVLITARLAGVVSACSRGSSPTSAPSRRSMRPATACACALAHAARARARRGRLGRRQRRVPDAADRGVRRARSRPTSCTSRCAAARSAQAAREGEHVNLELSLRASRPPRRPHRAGPRRRRRHGARRARGRLRRGRHDRRRRPDVLRYVVEKGSIAVDGVIAHGRRDRRRVLRGLADPGDAAAHDAGPRRRPDEPSTWRWTCWRSTSRSWWRDEPSGDAAAVRDRRGGDRGHPAGPDGRRRATTRTARTRAT